MADGTEESANSHETVHIRMTRELAGRLRREAKAQQRSVTQTAVILLTDALDRQDEAEAAERK